MIRSFLVSVVALAVWGCATPLPRVVLSTDDGDIVVEIDSLRAPVTATNFLRYIDGGRYDDAHFYRVVRPDNQPQNDIKIEVIQGGLGFGDTATELPPIDHETTETTGILHRDGTISMARREPGTASSEFFICVGDQPELDFGGRRNPDGQGFAAFGRVVEGMDVVRRIQAGATDGQFLTSIVAVRHYARVD